MICRKSGIKIHFWEELGTVCAVFPICTAQFIERYGSIHRRGTGHSHSLVKGDTACGIPKTLY